MKTIAIAGLVTMCAGGALAQGIEENFYISRVCQANPVVGLPPACGSAQGRFSGTDLDGDGVLSVDEVVDVHGSVGGAVFLYAGGQVQQTVDFVFKAPGGASGVLPAFSYDVATKALSLSGYWNDGFGGHSASIMTGYDVAQAFDGGFAEYAWAPDTTITVVPEPACAALWLLGLAGLAAGAGWRRR
jgi:hypothetical protein